MVINIIGTTRFSLFKPGANEWKTSQNSRFSDESSYLNFLFSDERMSLRIKIFTEYSVPQLSMAASKADINLKHIVSYSSLLPQKYKDTLYVCAENYPFLVLDERTPDQGTNTTPVNRYAELFGTEDSTFAWYRLDDDDIVSVDFFQQIAQYIRPENVGMTISLGYGYTGLFESQQFHLLRNVHWPFLAIGLTFVCSYQNGQITWVPPGPHTITDRRTPTIIDSRSPAWLWTRHLTQDTASATDSSENTRKILKELNKYPEVTQPELLSKLFPYLSEIIKTPKNKIYHLNNIALTEDKFIEFPQKLNKFTITLEADYSKGTTRNNSLASFSLVNQDGNLIPPDLKIPGLNTSANPRVGYWEYFNTSEGDSSSSILVSLPEGIFCIGATLIKWGRQETNITLKSLNITY